MTEDPKWWLLPISIVPGIGLLIMSTSARYLSVGKELANVCEKDGIRSELIETLLSRASCLQQALFTLYLALTLFAAASLAMVAFGGAETHMVPAANWLLVSGVALLTYSAAHLSWEILMSRKTLKQYRRCALSKRQYPRK